MMTLPQYVQRPSVSPPRQACPDVPIIYFATGGSPYFSEQVGDI